MIQGFIFIFMKFIKVHDKYHQYLFNKNVHVQHKQCLYCENPIINRQCDNFMSNYSFLSLNYNFYFKEILSNSSFVVFRQFKYCLNMFELSEPNHCYTQYLSNFFFIIFNLIILNF